MRGPVRCRPEARDFDYYERITVRDSSLSACIEAIVAAEFGHLELAYDYFGETAFIDLRDLAFNTRDGLHLTLAGGKLAGRRGRFWRDAGPWDRLSFAPRLPSRLTRLRFCLLYRGRRVLVDVSPGEVRYELLDADTLDGEGITLARGDAQAHPVPGAPSGARPEPPPGRKPPRRHREA